MSGKILYFPQSQQRKHARRDTIIAVLFGVIIYSWIIWLNLPFFSFLLSPFASFYVEGTCTIVEQHIDERQYDEYTAYYPAFSFTLTTNEGQVYPGRGYDWLNTESRSQEAVEQAMQAYQSGQDYHCWYHPWHPEWNMLRKDIDWSLVSRTSFWTGGLIALALVSGSLVWGFLSLFSRRTMKQFSPRSKREGMQAI